MKAQDVLTKAVRLALFAGASSAALTSTAAMAEDGANEKVERIAVTGSRIQRTDMETANPVAVFTAADIEKTGFSTVAEFLRTTASSGGFNESSTLSQAAGASRVGLKGFSSSYTLILLNGRRLPKNSAGGVFTDVNQLPISAVQRIDVLPDGASAIYGSDAVAGVINIITKKDFEGVDIKARYGAAVEHMDADEKSLSIVAGASNETTNILFSIEHFDRSPVQAVDREFGRTALIKGHPGGDGRSTWGIPGSLYLGSLSKKDANGNVIKDADGNVVPAAPITDANDGYAPWSDCPTENHASNGRCYYDFAPLYQLQPKSDRQSLFTQITHQASDDLILDGQFRYTRAYTLTSNAPAPGSVEVTDSPYLYDFIRNDRFKDDPETAEAVIQELKDGNAEAYVGRRYVDFPNREKDNTNETFEAVIGAEYSINDEWVADFDLGFSRLTNRQIGNAGQLIRADVEEKFADGTLNPFIINDCSSEELAQVCKDLQSSIHRTGEFEMLFSSLNFSGFTDFSLPGGEIGIATGLDYRKETYRDRADTASINGDVIGGAGSNGGGEATNKAAYVELSLPIIENLELNVAGRYDVADWGVSDASEFTYSAKVSYRPIDTLLLRASYGTGFKMPDLDDLYTAESFGVNKAVDTKLCLANGGEDCKKVELNSKSGGNPELQPETSKSFNVGVVYEVTDELSFSIDYWSLEIEDVIGSLAIQEILDAEAKGELAHLVKRNAAGRLDDSANKDVFVQSNLQNLTEQSATGINYDIQYASEFSFGTLRANLSAEQFLSFKTQSSAVQPLCDWVADDAYRKIRFNGGVALESGDLTTSVNLRFLPGYNDYDSRDTANKSCDLVGHYDVDRKNNDLGDAQDVASYIQFDVTTAYNISDTQKVSVGIRNLFDKQPVFSTPNDWPFYDQGTYDNIGRFVYLQYDVKL
ncbi:TonB-dependent receptor [Shewanella sp. OPT22]|nr:TonB-dependent receptor [Shewanella sp. OPT22]